MHYRRESNGVFSIYIDDYHYIDEAVENKIYSVCKEHHCELLTRSCLMSDKIKILVKASTVNVDDAMDKIMKVINEYGVMS